MPKIKKFARNDKLRSKALNPCLCEYTTWTAGEGTQLVLHLITNGDPYNAPEIPTPEMSRLPVQINLGAAVELMQILRDAFPGIDDIKPFDFRAN